MPAGDLEWLETNHRGSFALSCVDRRLRRKYHALLTVRQPAPSCDAWSVLAEVREHITHDGVTHTLSDPLYGAEATGVETLEFEHTPHATHHYRFDGVTLSRRVRLSPNHDQVEITYQLRGLRGPAQLALEPFVRARPIHALMVENPVLDGSLIESSDGFLMVPYQGMPALAWSVLGATAAFEAQGRFCTGVHYAWEAERGYASHEDVFCPGTLRATLNGDGELTLIVGVGGVEVPTPAVIEVSPTAFGPMLERACAQFVTNGPKATHERSGLVAGFPWFGLRSRDTLLALPGLHLAVNDEGACANSVLRSLLAGRTNGLIGETSERGSPSSLEASLLFIRAVQWLSANGGASLAEPFMRPVSELFEALADGTDTRFRLLPGDGILVAPGQNLTWMNAVTDGSPVTPREGHVVEIDALAYHGLCFALAWAQKHDGLSARRLQPLLEGSEQRFLTRYWSDARGYLADTHNGRELDIRMRPNQLWATALTCSPLTPAMKASVLNLLREELLVPAGLRSLSPRESAYRPHYRGNATERDRSYHQGSVWPGLLGLYADTVLNVRGRAALESELAPTLSFFAKHLRDEGCIGQVNEVFDGDAPHAPGGAPAQAWSTCELYRVWRLLHAGM